MKVGDNAVVSGFASQTLNNKNTQAQGAQSSQNFDAITQMLMSALDTNNTATIDKGEFTRAATLLAKNQSSENVENAFSKLDTNGDELISSNEFINALKEAKEKKEELKHHTNRNALDSTLLSDQINKLTKVHEVTDEAQKSLLNKITAAYTSTSAATGTRTNISV